jgi:hypothetical protein
MQKEFKSEALAAVHELMEALRGVGAIDSEAMGRFDDACLLKGGESIQDNKRYAGIETGKMDQFQDPPLKFLHTDGTLNRVKLDYFRRLDTETIIGSLKPEDPGCLKTRPDGTVLDGHHRLFVLEERGVNIHVLARVILEKEQ